MMCELLRTTEDGQKLVGVIRFDGHTITGHPEPGEERVLQRVLKGSVVAYDKKITKEVDPKAWFEGLPQQYNGSMFKARLVGMSSYAKILSGLNS